MMYLWWSDWVGLYNIKIPIQSNNKNKINIDYETIFDHRSILFESVLTPRARQVLVRFYHKCPTVTLKMLQDTRREDLFECRGCGPITLEEIEDVFLTKFGIVL